MKITLLALIAALALTLPATAQQTGSGDQSSAVPKDQPTPTAQDEGVVGRLKTYINKDKNSEKAKDPEPEGFYPRIGGLTTGSGIALGSGYRAHFVDRAFYADLSAIVSTKRYLGVDARLRVPSPAPERLELWTSVAFRRFPQEDYFGLGDAALLTNRSNYGIQSVDYGGQAIVHVTPIWNVGTDVGYFTPSIRAGNDTNFPSIELLFTDVTAPGLAEQPDFLHYGLFTALDYRDQRGNPRNGGYYRATVAQWNDQSMNAYDFRRFDAEVNQYVSLGSPRHVLVGRAGVSYVNNDAGERVPFYVFPYVGGANTVRSFREFRFRDENTMFLSGEYRLGVHKYVQLVGFLDGGKVAGNREDLTAGALRKGYGGGVRAGTGNRTFVRFDIGTGGGEGTRYFLKFFPSF